MYLQLFVSVKGINGAGLSSVSTSDGVYISYLSQGRPPLSPIGVFDMTDGEDVDVYVSVYALNCVGIESEKNTYIYYIKIKLKYTRIMILFSFKH